MMTMATWDPGTGIYLVTVQLADGRRSNTRVLRTTTPTGSASCAASRPSLDVDMHEMTDDELRRYGLIWDSPGTSLEEEGT